MAHTCLICHRDFASAKALQQHNQSTRRHANRCDRCNRTFRSQVAYSNHLATDPAHKDNYCTQHRLEFGSYYSLHLHFSQAHTDTYCDLCGQDFADSDALREHGATHHFCNICELDFDNSDQLREHQQWSFGHHYCHTCNKGFSSASELDYHWQRTHRYNEDDNIWDVPDYPSESGANFVEGTSTGQYTQREFPQIALDTSTVIYQADFYCRECNRSFWTSDALDQHRETTAEHRNTCALRSDSSVGSDAKGYTCPLCFEHDKDLSSAKCGHVFCTTCIHRALIEKSECPLCRAYSLTTDLRRIFLTF